MAIDSVPPLIAAQLNYLVSHCPFSVKVEQMWSGSKNPSLLDRFTLVVPYCLDYIRWDLIYNAMYPLAAPDVIFGPEDENFQPYLLKYQCDPEDRVDMNGAVTDRALLTMAEPAAFVETGERTEDFILKIINADKVVSCSRNTAAILLVDEGVHVDNYGRYDRAPI